MFHAVLSHRITTLEVEVRTLRGHVSFRVRRLKYNEQKTNIYEEYNCAREDDRNRQLAPQYRGAYVRRNCTAIERNEY